MYIRRLFSNHTSTLMTLPPKYLKHCGMSEGDQVTVVLNQDQTITIAKIDPRALQLARVAATLQEGE